MVNNSECESDAWNAAILTADPLLDLNPEWDQIIYIPGTYAHRMNALFLLPYSPCDMPQFSAFPERSA